ncbi:hypothetical protein ACFVTP_24370 [Streptomyces celluloflavus]
MRRGLVHVAAWTLATGAAATLSWFGVHTVLSGTAYDPPRALPLSDLPPSSAAHPDGGAAPRASSTHRPRPPEPPEPSEPARHGAPPSAGRPSGAAGAIGSGGDRGDGSAEPPRRPSPTPPPAAPPATGGQVKSYLTAGGRVVLDLGSAAAQLVSATPEPGWQMQVWKQEYWLRVDFISGGGHTSVICTWYDHAPIVDTSNNAT